MSLITGLAHVTQHQTTPYSVTPQTGATYTWSVTGGTIQSGQGTSQINVYWTVASPNNSVAITISQANLPDAEDNITVITDPDLG